MHSVFWVSRLAVAVALLSHLPLPQNPDTTAGPLSRQSSGSRCRSLAQTSTGNDPCLPSSVAQVLSGAPRLSAGKRQGTEHG